MNKREGIEQQVVALLTYVLSSLFALLFFSMVYLEFNSTYYLLHNHQIVFDILQTADGSVNQLPPWTEVQGDIRLTPFYNVDECMKKVQGYVAELNKGII